MSLQTLMATLLQRQLAGRGHTLELVDCEAMIGAILVQTAELATIAGEALAAAPRLVVDNGDEPA